MSRAVEILTNMADRIERDGLNKGGLFAGHPDADGLKEQAMEDYVQGLRDAGENPAVDVFGALYFETTDYADFDQVIPRLHEAFGFGGVPGFIASPAILDYTDLPETTSAQVVETLRRAAAVAA